MNQPAGIVFERIPALCGVLKDSLSPCRVKLLFTSDKGRMLRSLQTERIDLIILGPSSVGPGNGLELAREIRDGISARILRGPPGATPGILGIR